MIAKRPDARDELAPDLALERSVVEKRNVLRPGQADHDPQAMRLGFVEQVGPWGGVRADRVDAEIRHQAEVFGDAGARRKLIPVGIRRKSAVGDALDEEAVVAGAQELAVGRYALGRGKIRFWKIEGVSANGRAHNWE